MPDGTLGDLHEAIQVAMGWEDAHLHDFEVDGRHFGMITDNPFGFDPEVEDEDRVLLSQIVADRPRLKLNYWYDFGDDWRHEVVVERTITPETDAFYPRCVAGAAPVRLRTLAGSGATPSSSTPSPIRRTRATASCGSGSAWRSTLRRFPPTPLTTNSARSSPRPPGEAPDERRTATRSSRLPSTRPAPAWLRGASRSARSW